MLLAAPAARADDVVGAVGVNDLRSDGILVPHAAYDGAGDLDVLQAAGTTLYRGRLRLECTDPNHTGSFDFTGRRAGCGGGGVRPPPNPPAGRRGPPPPPLPHLRPPAARAPPPRPP